MDALDGISGQQLQLEKSRVWWSRSSLRWLNLSAFATPAFEALVTNLFDIMKLAGGIAAPQIGVSLQVVIFGFEKEAR